MSDQATVLELVEIQIDPIARPSHSLILADTAFMTTLKQVESTVETIKITDAQSAQQAADLLTRLTKAGTALEAQRVAIKRPYLTLMAAVDAAAKVPQARIDAAKRTLSKLQTDFAMEQARLARELEIKRLKDLADLEAKLARERKEAADKAAAIAEQVRREQEERAKVVEAARVAGLPVEETEDWGDTVTVDPEPVAKTATEIEIEAVRFAPAPVVAKPVGVKTVVTLFPRVKDIDLIPAPFITKTFKLAAAQATFCRGWREGDKLPECPGLEFEIQREVRSTGAAGF